MGYNKDMSHLMADWHDSKQKKIIKDQKLMASKVMTEFRKISKEDLLNHAVKNIYCMKLYDKESSHFYKTVQYPQFNKALRTYISNQLQDFYKETAVINEDGFNLMTYLEYILKSFDDNYHYWCSYPQISYDILDEADTYYFTIIQFDKSLYEKNLSFNQEIHPLIKALSYAWISNYTSRTYDDAFRKATVDMNPLIGRIWEHVNILSTLKYERSINHGSLLFYGTNTIHIMLALEKPVSLENYRQIRKLLQMCRQNHQLLINDSDMAIGFGSLTGNEIYYRIDFLGHLNWKLYKNDQELLSCSNLLPLLPATGDAIKRLKLQLKETFLDIPYAEDAIINMIELAKKQPKGTIIVITEKADAEAVRLNTSSIKIKPIILNTDQLHLVTSIDGAVIVDPRGYCHAVGTILDGEASSLGDASRGARYNSALRYLSAQKRDHVKCLIAVVSEDEYVDVISTATLL